MYLSISTVYDTISYEYILTQFKIILNYIALHYTKIWDVIYKYDIFITEFNY